jgi:predicted deacylase
MLNGQLIVAPISSMNAFARRSIYLCPPDNKNLNRQFPGKADGTFAEQLAYWIFHNLISRANFYIDLHGGDMNEALVPFSIIRRTDNADIFNQSLALAQAFGLPNIVASVGNGQTNSAAATAGIPSVLAEVGGQGLWPEDQVQQMSAGLRRAVAHTGLMPKSGDAPPPTRMIEDMVWLRSSHDGLFYPSCAVGDSVQKGQQLGHIKDFVGNVVEEVISPATGIVLFLVTTLAMNDNDPLLAVGA